MNRKVAWGMTGLAFMPIMAFSQARDPKSLLKGSIEALRRAGFPGTQEIQVPPPPSAVPASRVADEATDETMEALAALVAEVQKSPREGSVIGETLRKLGVDFAGDKLLVQNFFKRNVQRIFSVTSFRGRTDIILDEGIKAGGRKEIRSYLLSPMGVLEAAAVTTKRDGKFYAERIPNEDAQEGFRAQLRFWTQYYRDHLKPLTAQ
ncbi:MAG: hypothetical protein HY552_05690 [Elusimicrobia bacterium]|nr:hypothetical protein [Elusimicrobiota bacterium]